MAEAQFIPGSGNIVGALNSGIGTGASLMERSQAMRLRERQAQIAEEENARRQHQFEVLKPAMAAKATADIAEARAAVTGLEQAETARSWANKILPQARADFDDLMQLTDPDARELAGIKWIGTYGQLESVAAYATEFKSKKDIVAKVHTEAATVRHLTQQIEGQKEVAKIRGETAAEIATTNAGSRIETAQIRATSSDKIARLRQNLQEARDAGDSEGVSLYSGLLQKAQASPINTALGSEQMFQKLEEAKADGDADEVAYWEKRVRALTERGVRKPSRIDDPNIRAWLDRSPAPAPAQGTLPGPPTSTKPAQKAPGAPADPFANIKL